MIAQIRDTLIKAAALESMTDHSVFAMWIRDMESGRYVWANAFWYDFFEFTDRPFVGLTPFEAFGDTAIARAYHESDLDAKRLGHISRPIIAAFGNGRSAPVLTWKWAFRWGCGNWGVMGTAAPLED